ncbi:MAG: hypothetical protein Q4C64_03490 [Erysipelotrichia bacterium]|nr:hypothetical protein [Erysipelotrichia bacterium]
MNINDFIKQICTDLKILRPKILYKENNNGFQALYISNKKEIHLQKNTSYNYNLLFQTVIAVRYYYQDLKMTGLSTEQRTDDCLKYSQYFFDKYQQIELQFDESDEQLTKNLLK